MSKPDKLALMHITAVIETVALCKDSIGCPLSALYMPFQERGYNLEYFNIIKEQAIKTGFVRESNNCLMLTDEAAKDPIILKLMTKN